MEWTKEYLQIADYTLDFLSKDRSMYRAIHLDDYYFNASTVRPSREDEVHVFNALKKSRLIKTTALNPVIFCITDNGMNILRNYDSLSDYYEYDKKLRKKQEKEQKKANRLRKWDAFMKYVHDFNAIGKALALFIPIVMLILSIFFSEQVTTIKKTIHEYIKPDTPTQQTTTDTIQKPITLKEH